MLPLTTSSALVATSTVGFFFLDTILRLTPPSEDHVKKTKLHRWRNEVVSLFHAIFTGAGGMYCLILMLNGERKDASYSREVLIIGSVSTGYLLYDVIILLQHNPPKKVLGIAVHHIAMFGGFLVTYLTDCIYDLFLAAMVGYNTSIFLHSRLLLLMHGIDKGRPVFRANAVANLFGYVLFRIGTLVYILVSVLVVDYGVSAFAKAVGAMFTAVVLFINITVFRRLFISDWLMRGKESSHGDQDENILET